jgi:excisionase family DNA binding protein
MPIDPLLAMPHLLEVAHVAHRLSASEEFVRQLLRKKKLAAIRLGNRWRVDPQDLQKFIDGQRVANDGVDPSADTRSRRNGGDA